MSPMITGTFGNDDDGNFISTAEMEGTSCSTIGIPNLFGYK